MEAIKAMKPTMKSGVLTQPVVIASVAETNGMKNKQVKGVIEDLFAVACAEVKKRKYQRPPFRRFRSLHEARDIFSEKTCLMHECGDVDTSDVSLHQLFDSDGILDNGRQ